MKKAIESAEAPRALGPYSPAVEIGDLVFCSGQIGIDPRSGKMVEGGVEAETRRALESLREILIAAGVSFADVVKTTIFLADMKDWELVNRVYGEHLEPPYPARSTVQVAALPRHARVEIEMIARRSARK